MRFRSSILVGLKNVSPNEMVGNSRGNPPACHTPRFTASATSRRWRWHEFNSLQVLQMPMTGFSRSTLLRPIPLQKARRINALKPSSPYDVSPRRIPSTAMALPPYDRARWYCPYVLSGELWWGEIGGLGARPWVRLGARRWVDPAATSPPRYGYGPGAPPPQVCIVKTSLRVRRTRRRRAPPPRVGRHPPLSG